MLPKVVLLFALLAVAFAEKPRVGLPVPFLPSVQFSPRVVGGNEATKGAHPHIVSLQWGTSSTNTQHFCAGSILNANCVLTAGHCCQAIPSYGIFQIKAGKHNIKISEVNEQTVRVEKSIVHENYKGGVGPYDICLLKLISSMNMTREVQPINLPKSGSEPTGEAVLAGWGSTSKTSVPSMPDKLQEVKVPIIDIKTCSDAVKKLTGSSPVHETNCCTGPLTGGISACSGDSGGPLISSEEKELIGVVSWGIVPCGTTGAPSVYAKVASHTDWIEEQMAKY